MERGKREGRKKEGEGEEEDWRKGEEGGGGHETEGKLTFEL